MNFMLFITELIKFKPVIKFELHNYGRDWTCDKCLDIANQSTKK